MDYVTRGAWPLSAYARDGGVATRASSVKWAWLCGMYAYGGGVALVYVRPRSGRGYGSGVES